MLAQDIHFSQFDGALLNISPGFTGLFKGDYRLSAIYRTQWQSVPVSYSTFNMNAETRLKPRYLAKDMVGLGFSFYNDKAGDARYGSTQVYAQANYIHLAKPDSSLIITGGFNVGWSQIGFDLSKMTFDSQFDGIELNQALSSGERFTQTRTNYLDVNLGSVLQYQFSKRKKLIVALGLHHLTQPTLSYQGNDLSELDFKSSLLLSYTFPTGYNTDFIGESLLLLQGKNYELVPHIALKHYLNKEVNQAIQGGLCYRSRDAMVVRLGYNYKTFQGGMAYDITLSKFNTANNLRGAFELFVNYVFSNKGGGYQAKKRNCPVFM